MDSKWPKKGKTKNLKNADSFKTYLGSKQEGQGFADKRKRKTAYEYLKLLKKEKKKGTTEDGKELPKHKPIAFLNTQHRTPDKGRKKSAFNAAEKIARKRQQEREKKTQEAKRVKQEKDSALATYQDRKKKQHLKLCKRTSKGQPVMKYQMEVLLDKIQKQKGSKS